MSLVYCAMGMLEKWQLFFRQNYPLELTICGGSTGTDNALENGKGKKLGLYKKLAAQSTEDITTELVKLNPYRYAGYYWDRKTQYYYLQARYYDQRNGRFLSADTYRGEIGSPLSLNLYTYTANNPINYTDPSGHKISGKFGIGFASSANMVKYKIEEARTEGINSEVYWEDRAFLGSQAKWFFPNAKYDNNNYSIWTEIDS